MIAYYVKTRRARADADTGVIDAENDGASVASVVSSASAAKPPAATPPRRLPPLPPPIPPLRISRPPRPRPSPAGAALMAKMRKSGAVTGEKRAKDPSSAAVASRASDAPGAGAAAPPRISQIRTVPASSSSRGLRPDRPRPRRESHRPWPRPSCRRHGRFQAVPTRRTPRGGHLRGGERWRMRNPPSRRQRAAILQPSAKPEKPISCAGSSDTPSSPSATPTFSSIVRRRPRRTATRRDRRSTRRALWAPSGSSRGAGERRRRPRGSRRTLVRVSLGAPRGRGGGCGRVHGRVERRLRRAARVFDSCSVRRRATRRRSARRWRRRRARGGSTRRAAP